MESQYRKEFSEPIIRAGMTTNLGAVLFAFIPAVVLWLVFDAFPGWENILYGWFLIFAIYGISAVIEPVSFFPILGMPGTYLSFLSGNIGNMRVPVSAIAQESVGVELGTKKAELVSTIAIAGSVLTNLIVVTLAALFGVAILNALPQPVLDAFEYVAPAIFGSMFAMFASRDIISAIFGLTLVIIGTITGIIPTWAMILVATFATVAFRLWLYNRKAKQ